MTPLCYRRKQARYYREETFLEQDKGQLKHLNCSSDTQALFEPKEFPIKSFLGQLLNQRKVIQMVTTK